jgi:hypothetical protein
MLKRVLILFFLSYSLFLNAQKPFDPTTHIGIHGGVNFSAVRFTPSVNQDLLPSTAFGIFFRHVSEPNIGLQVEANYAGKGWRESIDSVGTYTRKIQTYDFPVMAAFIAGKRTLRFAFTIGPYLSYRKSNEEIIDIADTADFRAHYLQPIPRKWEFGFIGGVAVEIYTKIGGFAVRASYSHSISNLFPLNDEVYLYRQSRSYVIHAGVMYFISF